MFQIGNHNVVVNCVSLERGVKLADFGLARDENRRKQFVPMLI